MLDPYERVRLTVFFFTAPSPSTWPKVTKLERRPILGWNEEVPLLDSNQGPAD